MHGLAARSRDAGAAGSALYDSTATQATYDRLLTLARQIVLSGMSVIVDATFLKKEQRNKFEKLARDLDVPFFVFDIQADETKMRQRIASRAQLDQDPSDAGLHVLAHQMAEPDPLTAAEMKQVIVVDSELGMDTESVRKIAESVMELPESSFRRRTSA